MRILITHLRKLPNVVIRGFRPLGTLLKEKNSLPLGANYFLFVKRDAIAIDKNHCSFQLSPFNVRYYYSVWWLSCVTVVFTEGLHYRHRRASGIRKDRSSSSIVSPS